MGRPTAFTEELASRICEQIAEGVTLSDICRQDGMPTRQTVYNWMASDEEFSLRIARAREVGFDAIADECLKIADDHTRDVVQIDLGDGVKAESVDYDTIQRSKLRVETRLKLLAKWAPKKYGDKLDITANVKTQELPPWMQHANGGPEQEGEA